MTTSYEDMTWLPQAPNDFVHQVAAATTVQQLRELANHALDDGQLRRLSKRALQLEDDHPGLAPMATVRLGILSNSTTKLLEPALIGTAMRYGIRLQVTQAEYNQVAQEAFSSESTLAREQLDVVLVALDQHGYPLHPLAGDPTGATRNVEDCLAYVRSIVESLHVKTGAQIILQNLPATLDAAFGSYEGRLPGTLSWSIGQINQGIDQLVEQRVHVFDVATLAATVGLQHWHDPMQWNLAKLSFNQRYIPIYAEHLCRILAARLGKSRRCLVLDLDNTLWGGVIGDDGVEGILIGNGDPTAEAHLDVQRTALMLRERGVVLAVSSKNEDAAARLPFKEHPDMLLKEEHIAVFRANWSDKASNIRTIASTLSLGLESLVFLDDNPAERMLVRRELPEVAVPELPEDPALYARTLIAAGYFEAVNFLEEDRARAAFYQANALRAQVMTQSTDMATYLRSLGMEINFAPFDATGRARIAQLISKSNQFNLTTKRYSEPECQAFQEDPNIYTRQIRVKDVHGDNGMVCVVICRKHARFWEIDTWLMSCRVLGRRIEEAVLDDLATHAQKAGATKLVGVYKPTARNVIVKDHYRKLNFTKTSGAEEIEVWELDLSNYQAPELPMTLTYAV